MMNNAFYLILKSLFLLRDLHFCPDFLVMQESGLIRKLWLISKFMTSQTGTQTISINILPDISKSKANRTMKFVC